MIYDCVKHFAGFLDREAQESMVSALREAVLAAPLFIPLMPRTGRPFSVRMTNMGTLGWVSDRNGYRYQAAHPDLGTSWPVMPEIVLDVWRKVANYAALPEACLVNFYQGGAKMGLHQDKDEEDFAAPVVSISLGDTALFRFGGTPVHSADAQNGPAVFRAHDQYGDSRLGVRPQWLSLSGGASRFGNVLACHA